MSIKIRATLLAALLLTLGCGLVCPAQAARATAPAQPTPFTPAIIGVVIRDPWYEFGVNPRYPGQTNYEAQERMGAVLAEAGVRWVRLEFIFQQGAGSFDEQIARNDYFINVVAPRYGLKVLGLLAFRLVDVDPRDSSERGLISNQYQESPYGGGVNQYMEAWLDRALNITNRYQGKLAAYEVFNEPNRLAVIGNFAGGEGIAPERVATLHTKLYRCFKRNECAHMVSDPSWRAGVKLIVGGLHPRGSDKLVGGASSAALSDRDYLAALFSSSAFSGYKGSYGAAPADGIGYHPYPAEITTTLAAIDDEVARIGDRLDAVRARLREALQTSDPAAAELPFWVTEIGYNAAYPGQSVAGQATFLRLVYTSLAARGDVATVFWFKYEDFPPGSGPDAQRWGLVRVPFAIGGCPGGACYAASGEPDLRRPAFWALRELAGLPVTWVALPLVAR